eukprot:1502605-Prymnesium_polylepis.1
MSAVHRTAPAVTVPAGRHSAPKCFSMRLKVGVERTWMEEGRRVVPRALRAHGAWPPKDGHVHEHQWAPSS